MAEQSKYLQHLQAQREERLHALRTLRKRFLDSHNRMPTKKEEDIYISRRPEFGDPEYGKGEELPLEESHPEDYLPLFTAVKLGQMGAKGLYTGVKTGITKTSDSMIKTGGTTASSSRRKFLKNSGVVVGTGAAMAASPRVVKQLSKVGKKDVVKVGVTTGARVLPKGIKELMLLAEKNPKILKEIKNQHMLRQTEIKAFGSSDLKNFWTSGGRGPLGKTKADKVEIDEFVKYWNKRNKSSPISEKELIAPAIGAAALVSQMLKEGPVKAKGMAKRQGGWIGSAESKMSSTERKRGMEAWTRMNKGDDPKKIFKDTGWFQYTPGERRYVDFDFVDDMASGPLVKELAGEGGPKVVRKTPTLNKHVGDKWIKYDERDFGLDRTGVMASASPTTRNITKNTGYEGLGTFESDEAASHEIQHIIQQYQGTPSGTSTAVVKKQYSEDVLPMFAGRVYQHKLGEVEARTVQGYHMLARSFLDKGKSPEAVKAILRDVQPKDALKAYETKVNMVPTDLSKVWTNDTSMKNKWPTPNKPKTDAKPSKVKSFFGMNSERPEKVKSISKQQKTRPSHNMQNRLTPIPKGEKQAEMKWFLEQHDYSYFIKKDGTVSVDVYDSTGNVKRETASNMKELRNILGY